MTYADVVMWMWVAALVGTLVAFALAWLMRPPHAQRKAAAISPPPPQAK